MLKDNGLVGGLMSMGIWFGLIFKAKIREWGGRLISIAIWDDFIFK